MRAILSSSSVCVDLLWSDRPVTRLRRVAGVLALGLAGWLASLPSHAMVELTGISKIAAGDDHTCALTTAGGVKCWGYNSDGQLGDNTARYRPFAAPVLTFYATGTPSGSNSSLSLLANFTIASADVGRTGSFYIAVQLPTGELFFLTPSGFIQYTGGPMPTYSTDTLSNRSIPVLSGVNVTPFLGTILFAGYGLNDADLIENSKYSAIYTVQ